MLLINRGIHNRDGHIHHNRNHDDNILAQPLSCHSNRGVHSHHSHENIHDYSIQGQPLPPSCHSNHDDNILARHQPQQRQLVQPLSCRSSHDDHNLHNRGHHSHDDNILVQH